MDMNINLNAFIIVVAICATLAVGLPGGVAQRGSGRPNWGILFLFFISSVVGFLIARILTMKPEHWTDFSSMIMAAGIAMVPIFLIFLTMTAVKSSQILHAKTKSWSLAVIPVSLMAIAVSLVGEMRLLNGWADSMMAGTIPGADGLFMDWLHPGMFLLYYNLYTFTVGLMAAYIAGAVVALLKRERTAG
ncbi:hypothetical protein [Brevibacillus dissolubilis]|uniref:hypothetical protein n=1 Tax=Brevibacillus dissolubilis TaxID=1844116 RepID=UPI00111635E0|nr:hypothetical protein [Brevibacillus dissolubilis]